MKRVASRAIIFDKDSVYLFLRRKNGLEYFAVPGGAVEKDETIKDAVIREIKEEFSVDIKILGYLGMMEDDQNIQYLFHCEIVSGLAVLGGEEKIINSENNYYEIRKVNIKDIEKINLYEENRSFIRQALKKEYKVLN